MFRLTTDVASLFELGGTLIVPSRPRAHAVRLAHAAAALAAGRRVWNSPDVLSSAAWTRREAERVAAESAGGPRLLSAAEEWLLWRQCALEVTQGMPLLDAAALGDSLQQASALAAEFDIAPRAQSTDSEAELLLRAQRELAARCQALGARSAAAVLAVAGPPPRARGAPLMLRGFDVLPRRLTELAGAATATSESTVQPGGAASQPEQLLIAADEREELERIASWCTTRIRAQRDARLIVLLPGPEGPRERLATLIRQALDPGGSVGMSAATEALVGNEDAVPLAHVPLAHHALTTLALLQGTAAESGDWSRWLRAPHFSAPSEVARARLDARLRERVPATVTLREFLGALQVLPRELQPPARELGAQLTRAAGLLHEGRAAPRQWAERCRDTVKAAWGLATGATSAGAAQPLVHWYELLEEFGQLTGSVPLMSRAEAVRVLTDLAARTPLRAADEDASITISARLADPVVDYDGIWVAGLHADVFPQPVQPNPFLPLAAQRAAGVPTASAEGRIAQARELLRAWRARAGELVLSAPARAADLELLPSPLLAGGVRRSGPAPSVTTVWLPALLHRSHQIEPFVDEQGRRWNPAEPLPRGTRSLDLQNTCPFRAYAELRLGAARPEIPEPGVPLNLRGQLLHAALERLWAQLLDSRSLRRLTDETLATLIARCVQEAAAQLAEPQQRRRGHRPPSGQIDMFREIPRALARDCRRAEQLIAALCQLDRARGEFRVVSTEEGVDLRLAGARLRMRIDRIDELADGGLAVLDYKTGMHRAADWYGDRPTYPQLLAYLSALGEEVAAVAAVWVSARELRFDGVSRTQGLLPGVHSARAERGTAPEAAWQARRQGWRGILERLITAFLAGEAQLDPKPGACRGCHVIGICRIRERASARESPALEGADD